MASLPNTATKAELVEAHRNKMQWKKEQRQFARSGRMHRIRANLSRNHPDFGLSPAEHARRKAGA